jgi:hypothetical protein
MTPMDRSVMPQPLSASRRIFLLAFTGLVLLVVAATASSAHASYGEIGKPFGSNGKKAGQFTWSNSVHAVGVDPTDNSVYVGDEPAAGSETSSTYRIQKFDAKGKFIASVTFKVSGLGGNPAGLEGIAVDPKLGRVYALVVYEREEEEGPKGLIRIDPEEPAAGILYAFSTTPSGEELVPVSGAPGGVLASTEVLKAQSEVTANPAQAALLDPSGIAVDATTGEVIILGQEDQGGGRLLTAAQRVTSAGALGARWVDTHECFEGENGGTPPCFEEGEEILQPGEPESPIVTNSGRVLVDVPDEIWEIPKSFAAGSVPEPVASFSNPLQKLLSFPGSPDALRGGGLAYVHETGEPESGGRLYQAAELLPPGQVARYPAILEFELQPSGSLAELGWTAGQNAALEKETPCSISVFSQPVLGAGTGETAYVFDANKTSTEPAGNPHVAVFGPGGANCPGASASAPVATASNTQVGTTANPAQPGENITIGSTVTNANALSVQWSFDGVAQPVEEQPQFGATKVEHTFASEGTHTVKEVIKTDNLASPTIETSASIIVAKAKPVASFTVLGTLSVGSPIKFTSTSKSPDVNNSPLVKYVWKFGDGSTIETSSATPVEHTYAAAGKETVTLQITDALGETGSGSKEITVSGGAGGGGETNGGGTTNGGTTNGGTTNGGTTGGGATGGGTTSVLGNTAAKGDPEAKLASAAIAVSASGSFVVKVSCPAGETSCSGTITLRTPTAVKSSGKGKPAILTLATGSFSVGGGTSKSVTLHLSSKARTLLARSHSLRAKATLVAHDATGASRTTQATVTLKPAKKSAHH